MAFPTLIDYLNHWSDENPDRVWLRDRKGDQYSEWSWQQAGEEIHAVAAWLEKNYPVATGMTILSRNCAHWVMADYAVIAAGNIVIPMFTTLPQKTAEYILEFSDTRVLFLGEAENRQVICDALDDDVLIITLPGIEIDGAKTWDEIVSEYRGQKPVHQCQHDELISLVFTSGTTGVPKGVMQTHDSFVIPTDRFQLAFQIREKPRFLSYLPLSHIAERQLVEANSLLLNGEVTFNEGLPHLVRDLQSVQPNFFFGPPRVWEQLQQFITAQFDSQAGIDAALASDRPGTQDKVLNLLGLTEVDYCLTAAAPTPPSLIEWFETLGLVLMEGFGQTEAMGLMGNTAEDRRVGSIGKAIGPVDIRLSEQDELQVRGPGLATGYYKMPEKTAETFVDGWVHTGDKARIDDDGYIYITGRVKDYFKTIQGKFVAPTPIENMFAHNEHTEQQCLLGRGYSKTVMVCVLSVSAQQGNIDAIEADLRALIESINKKVDHHARLGALIISNDPWTIENEILTPTMKIRREKIEERFGETAMALAHRSAVEGVLLVQHWEK